VETVCHNRKNMTTCNDHVQDNEFIIKLDCQQSGTISGDREIENWSPLQGPGTNMG
jgi:hypothetical protein